MEYNERVKKMLEWYNTSAIKGNDKGMLYYKDELYKDGIQCIDVKVFAENFKASYVSQHSLNWMEKLKIEYLADKFILAETAFDANYKELKASDEIIYIHYDTLRKGVIHHFTSISVCISLNMNSKPFRFVGKQISHKKIWKL